MSKKTLNAANLQALGAEKLAALLIEVSTGSADIKRRLRLELSHNLGPKELAHDVRKRLATIRKSTSYVGWRKRKALIRDLSTQVAMIADKIAPDAPTLAFDLMWDFLDLTPSIFRRVDDSKGEVAEVFLDAQTKLADIAPRADLNPIDLADRVWTALMDNRHGQWNVLIPAVAPSLGDNGISHLKSLITQAPKTQRLTPIKQHALMQIANAQGDVDAYVAQFSPGDLARLDVSVDIASKFLARDRAQDALDYLELARPDSIRTDRLAWDTTYIAALTANGDTEAAQSHRWECFTQTLNQSHLRDYLKLLPDFDDVEAEDAARAHVRTFRSVSTALDFCRKWPDLRTAAEIVEARANEINGDHSALLTPVADALRERHPLAAVLIWRALIDQTLRARRTPRYGAIADHLADCAALDSDIGDYGSFPTHADFMRHLQDRHGTQSAFWVKVV